MRRAAATKAPMTYAQPHEESWIFEIDLRDIFDHEADIWALNGICLL